MPSNPPVDFESDSASDRPHRRSRWKKVLGCAAIGLVLLLIAAYPVGNLVLDRVSRRTLGTLLERVKTHDLEISEASFRTAHFSSWQSATWRDLEAKVRFTQDVSMQGSSDLKVNADTMIVRMTDRRRFTVEVSDFTTAASKPVETDENSEVSLSEDNLEGQLARRMTSSRVKGRRLQVELEMDPFDPWPSLEKVLPELIALATTGTTRLPVQIEGKVFFPIKGNQEATRFLIERVEGLHALRLSPVDLKFISNRFQDELTDAEIQVVAENPFRAPNLLRIKERAESTAHAAHQRDSTVPEDAYRHILWSYLLTNEYGKAFAQTVTDAHEEGPTGNTEAERQMDYRNNEVGRRYAVKGVVQKSILKRLRADPDVILKAR